MLAIGAALPLVAACPPTTLAARCDSHSDCPDGFVCDAERRLCLHDVGGPDAGSTDAGDPDAGGPDADGPDAGGPDADGPDTGGPDAGHPGGISNVDPAWLCAGSESLLVSGDLLLDTDEGTIDEVGVPSFQVLDQGGSLPSIAVFSFDTIEVTAGSRLSAVGSRALALLACGTVELAGLIDVSAVGDPAEIYMQQAGPGGFDGGDKGQPGAGPGGGAVGDYDHPVEMESTGSGGAGHGAAGGEGGPYLPHSPGAGGAPYGVPDLIPLVGGSGGAGQVAVAGYGPEGDHDGVGGGGGGAVQISAGTVLRVLDSGGVVAAGGGGGQTGNGGGAGGGAGGAILLEAPEISILSGAVLAANGGGGAAGDCP